MIIIPQEKNNEIDALSQFLETFLADLPPEEAESHQEKLQLLKCHWKNIKQLLGKDFYDNKTFLIKNLTY